jgi:hypothetical protein
MEMEMHTAGVGHYLVASDEEAEVHTFHHHQHIVEMDCVDQTLVADCVRSVRGAGFRTNQVGTIHLDRLDTRFA